MNIMRLAALIGLTEQKSVTNHGYNFVTAAGGFDDLDEEFEEEVEETLDQDEIEEDPEIKQLMEEIEQDPDISPEEQSPDDVDMLIKELYGQRMQLVEALQSAPKDSEDAKLYKRNLKEIDRQLKSLSKPKAEPYTSFDPSSDEWLDQVVEIVGRFEATGESPETKELQLLQTAYNRLSSYSRSDLTSAQAETLDILTDYLSSVGEIPDSSVTGEISTRRSEILSTIGEMAEDFSSDDLLNLIRELYFVEQEIPQYKKGSPEFNRILESLESYRDENDAARRKILAKYPKGISISERAMGEREFNDFTSHQQIVNKINTLLADIKYASVEDVEEPQEIEGLQVRYDFGDDLVDQVDEDGDEDEQAQRRTVRNRQEEESQEGDLLDIDSLSVPKDFAPDKRDVNRRHKRFKEIGEQFMFFIGHDYRTSLSYTASDGISSNDLITAFDIPIDIDAVKRNQDITAKISIEKELEEKIARLSTQADRCEEIKNAITTQLAHSAVNPNATLTNRIRKLLESVRRPEVYRGMFLREYRSPEQSVETTTEKSVSPEEAIKYNIYERRTYVTDKYTYDRPSKNKPKRDTKGRISRPKVVAKPPAGYKTRGGFMQGDYLYIRRDDTISKPDPEMWNYIALDFVDVGFKPVGELPDYIRAIPRKSPPTQKLPEDLRIPSVATPEILDFLRQNQKVVEEKILDINNQLEDHKKTFQENTETLKSLIKATLDSAASQYSAATFSESEDVLNRFQRALKSFIDRDPDLFAEMVIKPALEADGVLEYEEEKAARLFLKDLAKEKKRARGEKVPKDEEDKRRMGIGPSGRFVETFDDPDKIFRVIRWLALLDPQYFMSYIRPIVEFSPKEFAKNPSLMSKVAKLVSKRINLSAYALGERIFKTAMKQVQQNETNAEDVIATVSEYYMRRLVDGRSIFNHSEDPQNNPPIEKTPALISSNVWNSGMDASKGIYRSTGSSLLDTLAHMKWVKQRMLRYAKIADTLTDAEKKKFKFKEKTWTEKKERALQNVIKAILFKGDQRRGFMSLEEILEVPARRSVRVGMLDESLDDLLGEGATETKGSQVPTPSGMIGLSETSEEREERAKRDVFEKAASDVIARLRKRVKDPLQKVILWVAMTNPESLFKSTSYVSDMVSGSMTFDAAMNRWKDNRQPVSLADLGIIQYLLFNGMSEINSSLRVNPKGQVAPGVNSEAFNLTDADRQEMLYGIKGSRFNLRSVRREAADTEMLGLMRKIGLSFKDVKDLVETFAPNRDIRALIERKKYKHKISEAKAKVAEMFYKMSITVYDPEEEAEFQAEYDNAQAKYEEDVAKTPNKRPQRPAILAQERDSKSYGITSDELKILRSVITGDGDVEVQRAIQQWKKLNQHLKELDGQVQKKIGTITREIAAMESEARTVQESIDAIRLPMQEIREEYKAKKAIVDQFRSQNPGVPLPAQEKAYQVEYNVLGEKYDRLKKKIENDDTMKKYAKEMEEIVKIIAEKRKEASKYLERQADRNELIEQVVKFNNIASSRTLAPTEQQKLDSLKTELAEYMPRMYRIVDVFMPAPEASLSKADDAKFRKRKRQLEDEIEKGLRSSLDEEYQQMTQGALSKARRPDTFSRMLGIYLYWESQLDQARVDVPDWFAAQMEKIKAGAINEMGKNLDDGRRYYEVEENGGAAFTDEEWSDFKDDMINDYLNGIDPIRPTSTELVELRNEVQTILQEERNKAIREPESKRRKRLEAERKSRSRVAELSDEYAESRFLTERGGQFDVIGNPKIRSQNDPYDPTDLVYFTVPANSSLAAAAVTQTELVNQSMSEPAINQKIQEVVKATPQVEDTRQKLREIREKIALLRSSGTSSYWTRRLIEDQDVDDAALRANLDAKLVAIEEKIVETNRTIKDASNRKDTLEKLEGEKEGVMKYIAYLNMQNKPDLEDRLSKVNESISQMQRSIAKAKSTNSDTADLEDALDVANAEKDEIELYLNSLDLSSRLRALLSEEERLSKDLVIAEDERQAFLNVIISERLEKLIKEYEKTGAVASNDPNAKVLVRLPYSEFKKYHRNKLIRRYAAVFAHNDLVDQHSRESKKNKQIWDGLSEAARKAVQKFESDIKEDAQKIDENAGKLRYYASHPDFLKTDEKGKEITGEGGTKAEFERLMKSQELLLQKVATRRSELKDLIGDAEVSSPNYFTDTWLRRLNAEIEQSNAAVEEYNKWCRSQNLSARAWNDFYRESGQRTRVPLLGMKVPEKPKTKKDLSLKSLFDVKDTMAMWKETVKEMKASTVDKRIALAQKRGKLGGSVLQLTQSDIDILEERAKKDAEALSKFDAETEAEVDRMQAINIVTEGDVTTSYVSAAKNLKKHQNRASMLRSVDGIISQSRLLRSESAFVKTKVKIPMEKYRKSSPVGMTAIGIKSSELMEMLNDLQEFINQNPAGRLAEVVKSRAETNKLPRYFKNERDLANQIFIFKPADKAALDRFMPYLESIGAVTILGSSENAEPDGIYVNKSTIETVRDFLVKSLYPTGTAKIEKKTVTEDTKISEKFSYLQSFLVFLNKYSGLLRQCQDVIESYSLNSRSDLPFKNMEKIDEFDLIEESDTNMEELMQNFVLNPNNGYTGSISTSISTIKNAEDFITTLIEMAKDLSDTVLYIFDTEERTQEIKGSEGITATLAKEVVKVDRAIDDYRMARASERLALQQFVSAQTILDQQKRLMEAKRKVKNNEKITEEEARLIDRGIQLEAVDEDMSEAAKAIFFARYEQRRSKEDAEDLKRVERAEADAKAALEERRKITEQEVDRYFSGLGVMEKDDPNAPRMSSTLKIIAAKVAKGFHGWV